MKTLLFITSLFLATGLFCNPLAAQTSSTNKIKVLVITGGHGFEKVPFLDIFEKNSEIVFTHAEHSKKTSDVYDRADLFDFDVVVLYDMVQNITEAQKEKFLKLTEKGIGLVVLHHALVSYQAWPEFHKIIGGSYPEDQRAPGKVTEQLGYLHDIDLKVLIVAKDHPTTAGLKDFVLNDEIYWGFKTEADSIPLLTTSHPKSGKPLAWHRIEKKSRIIYLQSGHGPSAYQNENYRKFLAQSIRWTANRSGNWPQ